ncbi:MAG: hypothetical protein JO362_03275 [Streptomycetaceae bacterium]|nr:hypothetical protein [Streptomycetaceae bacterium]
MLELPGSWMRDFWLADDGERYHLFFLDDTATWTSSVVPHSDGGWFMFSTDAALEDDEPIQRIGTRGGIWAAPADGLLGPYDIGRARQITGSERYAGRFVRNRGGQRQFLPFPHDGLDGSFVEAIADPVPVRWAGDRIALGTGTPVSATR